MLGALLLGTFAADGHGQVLPEGSPEHLDRGTEQVQEIATLFYSGDYPAVLTKTRRFFEHHPLSPGTVPVLLFAAASHDRLGQSTEAIAVYTRTLPHIEQLSNVLQRRYAWVFFRLGLLHRQGGQFGTAIRFTESGLIREPQNVYYQILLGELFAQTGDPDRARAHWHGVLTSAAPNPEERVVLRIKIDRLSTGVGDTARRIGATTWRWLGRVLGLAASRRDAPFYVGFDFGLVPLHRRDATVSLHDLCVLMESKWLVPCAVLEPVAIDESGILDPQRRQYDGDRLLAELGKRYPPESRPRRFIVGVTDGDLFGPGTNFVFSWQSPRDRLGVVSTIRFLAELDDFYERPTIATRRLGIQLLSTTGSMLGFTRPTRPDCPLAYPHDFREFLMKGSKLCESTIQQRDALLARIGGAPSRFGPARSAEVERVYETFHFD